MGGRSPGEIGDQALFIHTLVRVSPVSSVALERFSFDRIVGIKPEKWDRHRSSLARASPIFLDRSIQKKTALEWFSFDRIVGIKPEKWDRHRSSLARASPIFLDRSIQKKTALNSSTAYS